MSLFTLLSEPASNAGGQNVARLYRALPVHGYRQHQSMQTTVSLLSAGMAWALYARRLLIKTKSEESWLMSATCHYACGAAFCDA